jgi:fatty-acyl-CoA synthase
VTPISGVRDRQYADHAHAAVEPRPGVRCSADDLAAHVAARLSAQHVPARITLWPDLPLLPSGKPDQQALRQASLAVAQSGA